MRPAPDEVIAGVRALLKQEVGPSLPKHAQPHLRRIMSVLRDGRWNEAAFDLLRENTLFASLALKCVDALDAAAQSMPDTSSLAEELRAAAGAQTPATFAAANEINRRSRAALCQFIETARDHRAHSLDDVCSEIGASLLAMRAD